MATTDINPIHGNNVLISEQSVSAGATESAIFDKTGKLDAWITAFVENGSTGPTEPCIMTVRTSHDGTAGTWVDTYELEADDGNSEKTDFVVSIPAGVGHLEVEFGGHTAEAVTVFAAISYVDKFQHD